MEKFTNKELEIISNGLLSLIVNAVKAKGLVTDTASQNSIDDYMKILQALNSKVLAKLSNNALRISEILLFKYSSYSLSEIS
jgi:hypothetical protein